MESSGLSNMQQSWGRAFHGKFSFPISFLDPSAPTESNPTEPGKGKYDQDSLYENFKE